MERQARVDNCIGAAVLMALRHLVCFFFFQAEDGIRDLTVTGVQACALPISPHIYGGAGVVVDELTRALSRRMPVEVRCFGERRPEASSERVAVRGYTPWERLAAGNDGARYAPALETLSIDLAMARDPVDADVAHAHTWYADMAGLWIRTLPRIPPLLTLDSTEPLRPWETDQLGSGELLSSWIQK